MKLGWLVWMDHRYEALIGRCGGIKDMELGWYGWIIDTGMVEK